MTDYKENALVRSLQTPTRADNQEPSKALCIIYNTMMSLAMRRTNFRKEKAHDQDRKRNYHHIQRSRA